MALYKTALKHRPLTSSLRRKIVIDLFFGSGGARVISIYTPLDVMG